jgi:hypothetical protein
MKAKWPLYFNGQLGTGERKNSVRCFSETEDVAKQRSADVRGSAQAV